MFHHELILKGEKLLLNQKKSIFWYNQNMLIVADLHLGKAVHFRKAGIAAPAQTNDQTLNNLASLIDYYQVSSVLILGDLFHSRVNSDWQKFINWKSNFQQVNFILVKGNHDLLSTVDYQRSNLRINDKLVLNPFLFIHDSSELSVNDSEKVVMSGHIHPAVKLSGKGRQKITLSCFLLKKNNLILPAFGSFTGTYKIPKSRNNRIFAITDESVIEI
ncbi:MAG TPA: ligase-associated DNA damage response endonuclease PdeM [Balneolaceae bacterium]|nr:ligase-associated DNA damage response endonuclease PdeM [Balneolaceae bacterium]